MDEILYEQKKHDITYHANMNGYLLLSGKSTLGDILGYKDESYCTFDPYNLIEKSKFEDMKSTMIDYFSDIEDYEKCAYLRDYSYIEYQTVVFKHQKDN